MSDSRSPASGVVAANPEAAALSVSPLERVARAVAALREDTRDDAALGDAASQTRNIAVSDAASFLRNFISDSRDHAKTVVEAGGTEAVILALRRRPNSEAVQSKATSALSMLAAASPASRRLAGQAGGVEVVISALRGHPASEMVQLSACEALSHLIADDEDNRELARQGGGVDAAIIALEQHAGSEALQRCASTVLGLLVMGCYESQMQAGGAQGVDALVRALQQHQTSEAVQESAVEALGHLVAQNRENQGRARDACAIPTSVEVLQRFPQSRGVQLKALRTLRDLVIGNCRNQTIAGQTEAFGAISSALSNHEFDEDVKTNACETLAHLVLNSPAQQDLAREAGLVEAVIRGVLAKHLALAGVQMQGLFVLGALASGNAVNQRLAGETGGLDVVTAALKRFVENEAVMEFATEAMGHLVALCPDNQVLAGHAGSLEAVVAALSRHPESTLVRPKGLYALRTLIMGAHTNTMLAVSAGGIQDVLSAIQHCLDGQEDPGTPTSSSPEQERCQQLAKEAGVIEAVVSALKEQWRPAESKACLLNALSGAVVGNYENQRLAAEAGAIDAVVGVVKSSFNIECVQEAASRALSGLIAENAMNQRLAKDLDADETLLYAKDLHFESPQVQMAIICALDALCSGEVFHERIMKTEYGRRHQTYSPIADTAMRGVTLEQILELQDFIQETLRKYDLVDPGCGSDERGSSITWEDLTMYQVRDHFIMPLTRASKCSFVEVVAQGKQQPPMWMVSHWWGTPFNFSVRMLELQARSRHLHGAASVSYWCDTFANNPHGERMELDEGDVLKSPFARAMLSPSCMGTVLLCDPNVTPLLRTWCVFEAHITQQLRSGALADRTDKKRFFLDILATSQHQDLVDAKHDKVTITMLQDAVGGSWNEVSDTEGVFFPLGIAHVGVGIDVRRSEASVESDRASILNYLTEGVASKDSPAEDHPKYDETNNVVHEVFASAELYRVASEQEDECVEAATALLKMRADVNSFVRHGNTPLFAAAGADPASCGVTNSTAQHDLMKVLLTARAEVNHANGEMKTVLDCASALSEDARELLLEHGAKTYADAAPELEKAANTRLAQILSTGFGSERQAFIGGDAGTRLTQAAQRSLQVAASSVLKLYHWAPCRIGVQTGNGRHQAQLADQRADSVRLSLQSAGCRNSFDIRFGAQKALLSMTVCLAPPGPPGKGPQLPHASVQAVPCSPIGSPEWERRALGAAQLDLVVSGAMHPRSPQAVLGRSAPPPAGLRTAPSKLPPVASSPARTPAAAEGHSGPVPITGPSTLGRRDRLGPPRLPGGGLKPCPVPQELDAAVVSGRPQPQGAASPGHAGADGRPATSQGPRQVGLPGMRHMPWSQIQGGGPSRAARSSSQPQTPPANSVPAPRAAKDLDTIAGDRWFQTSITCSWSTPALHSSGAQTGGQSPTNKSKAAKGPGEHDTLAGGGWPEGNAVATPASAATSRPAQAGGDGRPPTRGGVRRTGTRPTLQACSSEVALLERPRDQDSTDASRRYTLPTLTQGGSQRPVSQVFTVSDLDRV